MAKQTGRQLLRIAPGMAGEAVGMLRKLGIRTVDASEFHDGVARADMALDAEAVILPNVETVILASDSDVVYRLRNERKRLGAQSPVLAIEEEVSVRLFLGEVLEEKAEDVGGATAWHLEPIGVTRSRFTGAGVRVAVLDTGLDLSHPDFGSVNPGNCASFVYGTPSPLDGHGHGTHTAGLVAGPASPVRGPRYGAAPDVELLVGKVISDGGVCAVGELFTGIDWALNRGCSVILLALEMRVPFGEPFSRAFEARGSSALARGSLLIAAVGNDSRRPTAIEPVSAPANCPSVFGVGAVDATGTIFDKSNGSVAFPGAGLVDVVAPGVTVWSSDIGPTGYGVRSGTSMAAALVVGVAALYQQANPSLSGISLGGILKSLAILGPLNPSDAGQGLVRAPV